MPLRFRDFNFYSFRMCNPELQSLGKHIQLFINTELLMYSSSIKVNQMVTFADSLASQKSNLVKICPTPKPLTTSPPSSGP